MATTVPTKHILLQKENISTHDKTWQPARLLAPNRDRQLQPNGHGQAVAISYEQYLLDYELYLNAIQHMKRVHLSLVRKVAPAPPRMSPRALDPPVQSKIPELVKALERLSTNPNYPPGTNERRYAEDLLEKTSEMTSEQLVGSTKPSLFPEVPLAPPRVFTDAEKATRKANRRARQRAAARRKREAKKVEALSSQVKEASVAAEAAKATMTRIRSERKLQSFQATSTPGSGKPKGKKSSPSRQRRLDKRRAAREA